MKSRAAVLWEIGKDWQVEEMDIDSPGPGEVLAEVSDVGGPCDLVDTSIAHVGHEQPRGHGTDVDGRKAS